MAKRKTKAARNEALEAAILADPSEPGAYQVYGDWLQQQGDPRGELVAVQHALLSARGKEFAQLKVREQEILDAEPAHFFGPLAQFRKARRTALDWYCGFVSGMRGNFEKHVDAFLAHPSGIFVQSIEDLPLPKSIPALRRVKSYEKDYRDLASFVHLEDLEVRYASQARIAFTRHPKLAHVRLDGAKKETLLSLAKAELPAIESLALVGLRLDTLPAAVKAIEAHPKARVELGFDMLFAGGGSVDPIEPILPRIETLVLDHMPTECLELLRPLTFPAATKLHVPAASDENREVLFTMLPKMPRVQSVELFFPMDTVRYFRGFAQSELASRIEELTVHIGKPAAGRALTEGAYPKLEKLALSFDSMFSAEYLKSDVVLESKAFANVRALTLHGSHFSSLAGSPLASTLESLTLGIEQDGHAEAFLKKRKAFESLERLVVTGSRVLSPKVLTKLFALDLDVRYG